MYIFELKINNPVEVLDQTIQPAQSLKKHKYQIYQ